jgi:hypothetical protein
LTRLVIKAATQPKSFSRGDKCDLGGRIQRTRARLATTETSPVSWTNGQVERMNGNIKEATVKRYHCRQQFEVHLTNFVSVCNFGRRRKTFKDLTPYGFICKVWTEERKQFSLNPSHQRPRLDS